jgi:septation ring formation regulator EzrA
MKTLVVSFLVVMVVVAIGAGLFFRKSLRELDELSKWGE